MQKEDNEEVEDGGESGEVDEFWAGEAEDEEQEQDSGEGAIVIEDISF